MIGWSGLPDGTMRAALRALAVLCMLAAPAAAQVQVDPAAPLPPALIPGGTDAAPPAEAPIDPTFGLPTAETGLPDAAAPYAPPDVAPDLGLTLPVPETESELLVTASLIDQGPALKSGIVWRVYGAVAGEDGTLPLVATGKGGAGSFKLAPGVYLVHCGFGYAGTTVRVELNGGLRQEAIVLNAGGLKLEAFSTEDRPLPPEDVRFDVYSKEIDQHGERKIVARDVKPGDLVRLTADTYSIVSRYGLVNAQTRADVEVKAGKLTEVTLYQKAAEVTLKLVGEPGGEAIADTRWSILTPGGDIVTEGVGAFPSFILAAGEYTVVAKHSEDVFQRDFNVESGRNAEVEVLADASTRSFE